MKGLELCRAYYLRCAREELRRRFGARAERIAAGLAGEGSECLGFDDEISRDHDFGPGFCLWLADEDFSAKSCAASTRSCPPSSWASAA